MSRVRLAFFSAALIVASISTADEITVFGSNSAPRSIDVIVTDNRGNHIAGLARSDFQILEDGVARDVTKFTALTRAADGTDIQPPRSILLVFDETSISLGARKTTVNALRTFIESRVRPIDRAMVVTVVGVGGVLPATSWTSRKEDLLKALDAAETSSIGNKGYERRETERNIQATISYAMSSEAGGNTTPISFDTIMQNARQYASVMQQEARATAGALNEALGFLGSGPGKKIAVIAGGGLSTRPGSDIFQYMEGIRQQAILGNLGVSIAHGASFANPTSEGSRYEITDVVRDVARSARDRGVIVYAVDPDTSGTSIAQVERTTAQDTTEEFVGVADRLSGYQMLSATTGGLTLTGRGVSQITEITNDLDTHYILGYTQTLNSKGKLPKTEVKLLKPGRVRQAFTGGPETSEAVVQDTVIANHATGAVWTNDLQIALFKEKPEPDAEGRRVKLRVLIPVKSLKLTPEGNEVVGGFAVYISTGDDRGNAGPINRQKSDIRWPADKLPEMIEKTIGFNVDVVMKPGKNQISVGVMDRRSQQTGFAKTTL